MAIQFTDFSKAPLLDSPAKTIFEDVLKGYQMSQVPGQMKQEASARELANQLKKLEVDHKPKEYALGDQQKSLANALQSKALEHYEEKFGLERDLKKAQIDKAKRAGMAAGLSPSGDVKNAEFIYQLKQSGADPKHIEVLEKAFNAGMEHTESITNRSKDVVAGNAFDKLPTNDKKQSVALMKGMGVDPVEAVSYLRQKGNTPSTYAQDKGIDINGVQPDYALGEQNVKDAQRASSYLDEIDGLDKHISEGLGQYQNKLMGYSFDQIADAAKGEDPDKQGRVLAARALLPELNALRLKIAGGNIGIEALKELEHKSLGQLNIIESLVDDKAYMAAQKYMRQWIDEAGRTRIKSLNKFSMLKSGQQKSAEAEAKGGKVLNLATGQWEDE